MGPRQTVNLTSSHFFFGASVILILVAIILTVGRAWRTKDITFGNCRLKATIAETDSEKAQGLAGRNAIGQNEAMLFPFSQEQPSFWMKGMRFSIDIIWISRGRIIQIDTSLPLDDGANSYRPSEPIDWVLEVADGRSNACAAAVGQVITELKP